MSPAPAAPENRRFAPRKNSEARGRPTSALLVRRAFQGGSRSCSGRGYGDWLRLNQLRDRDAFIRRLRAFMQHAASQCKQACLLLSRPRIQGLGVTAANKLQFPSCDWLGRLSFQRGRANRGSMSMALAAFGKQNSGRLEVLICYLFYLAGVHTVQSRVGLFTS